MEAPDFAQPLLNKTRPKPLVKKRIVLFTLGCGLVLLAILLPAVLVTLDKGRPRAAQSDDSDDPYYNQTHPLNPLALPSSLEVTSGKDGSQVVTYINGSQVSFTYSNPFGGYYYLDPLDPFGKSGKAQSWTPAITEEWIWGRDLVRGVNLGGWLVVEPFIVPGLFQGQWQGVSNERCVFSGVQ